MTLPISSTAIVEKNSLSTDGVFLLALKILIPGTPPVYVVRNTDDITWAGQLYQAFPFEVDEIGQGKDGAVPQVNLRVSNVGRALESYVQAYDAYCKANGYSRIFVTIYVVNSKNLSDPTPECEHEFILKNPQSGEQWMTFVLGASNPFRMRSPMNRILKNRCTSTFKDARCQYAGAVTSCDHTLPTCRNLGNQAHFGGFPSAGPGGLNVSTPT
jgi:lambda family phage minor tail protein L